MNTKVVLIWLSIYAVACTSHEKTDTLLVRGSIENLQDGKMYLSDWGKRIDSTNTKDGKFVFKIPTGENFDPKYVGFSHIAHSDSILRVLCSTQKLNTSLNH